MPKYAPPFTITPAILSMTAKVSELVGRLDAAQEMTENMRLRKASRIRTIHGSLAIEGNTLSREQVTAIIEGKRVLAPPQEIQEVRNAIKAYARLDAWTPHSERDLLDAHRILMTGLIDEPGVFRSGGVGVLAGNEVIHLAPPAKQVPRLMDSLLQWLEHTEHHPLIASAVFHYEFEFIHPFEDGNGRLGRLWQTLIMCRWNRLFLMTPVESLVHEHQTRYYAAISNSTKKTDAAPFIAFMLEMIHEALQQVQTPEVAPEVTPEVKRLIRALKAPMTRRELMQKLGLKDEKNFRENYLKRALAHDLIEMTIPDKPTSRLQQYTLTPAGLRRRECR